MIKIKRYNKRGSIRIYMSKKNKNNIFCKNFDFYDFDGYDFNTFYEKNGYYVAHLIELPEVSAFAHTKEQAIKELSEVWQIIKQGYKENNFKLPQPNCKKGKINFKSLHNYKL